MKRGAVLLACSLSPPAGAAVSRLSVNPRADAHEEIVGDPDDLKPGEHFDYPIFKGFYSGVRWLQLNTYDGQITAIVEQHRDSPIYVQVFTPKTAPSDLLGKLPCHSRLPEFLSCTPSQRLATSSAARNPRVPWARWRSLMVSTRATSAFILGGCRHGRTMQGRRLERPLVAIIR
jgi:hypothetical protein